MLVCCGAWVTGGRVACAATMVCGWPLYGAVAKRDSVLYVGVYAVLTFVVCCVGGVCLCVVDWWVNVRRVLWAAA